MSGQRLAFRSGITRPLLGGIQAAPQRGPIANEPLSPSRKTESKQVGTTRSLGKGENEMHLPALQQGGRRRSRGRKVPDSPGHNRKSVMIMIQGVGATPNSSHPHFSFTTTL